MKSLPPIIKYPLRILFVVLLILLILWIVKIDQVAKGEGVLIPREEFWICSLVEAQIESICVKEGDVVASGDTLIRLDNKIVQFRLKSAENDYLRAKAEREVARSELEALESPLRTHELEILRSELRALREKARIANSRLHRERALMARGGLTSAERLEEIVSDSVLVTTQIAKLLSEIALQEEGPILPLRRKAQFELEAKEAEVARTSAEVAIASHVLANHTIRAPVAGRAYMISYQPGNVVAVGDTLLLIAPLEPMLAKCYIPSEFGPWIRVGQEVTLSPEWERSYEFSGHVYSVRRYVEPKSRPSVLVHVEIDSQPPLILGNRLRVEIKLRRERLLKLLFSPFDWTSATEL